MKFDETRRGYHGGAKYREEQSRPDDWNVVEWSNATRFKPTTTPKPTTKPDEGSSSEEKLRVGSSKMTRDGRQSETNRSKPSSDDLQAIAERKAQQSDSSGEENHGSIDMMNQTTQGCSGTLPTLNEPTTNTGEQEMTKIVRWSFSMKITEKVKYLSEEATWKGLEALKSIRRVVGTI